MIRTFAISQHTTVLRIQTHIEHHDCSVNDDITISFYLFDTAKIVYTSSADHRPLHPESDSFCSFFNFTAATFPGAHNSPIRLLLGAQVRPCVLPIFLFLFSVRGSHGFWERTAFSFLFTAACFGRFVFCFDYISIWHCISNQRLVPCNRLDALQDPPSWDTSSPHDRCHHDAPTVARFPLTGTALGPRRVVYSTSHATWKPNRIDPTLPVRRGHTSQGQDGCSPKDGHLFGGMWGSLRSDTLCYFVAPRAPMQFLGDNGEDTTHSYINNRHTCKHMCTHTGTHTINHQKTTNSRNGEQG